MQTSGTDRTLRAVHFTDTQSGVAVGEEGKIFRTTDGGRNWGVSTCDVAPLILNDVCFVGAITGWAVGEFHSILRTSDGGKSWETIDRGGGLEFTAVSFATKKKGIAAAVSGVYHTVDGGDTWVRHELATREIYFGVSFGDTNTATLVGGGPGTGSSGIGAIHRTVDGGQTWIRQDSGTGWYLRDVCCTDSLTATAVGDGGTILRTIDGGRTWANQPRGVNYSFQSVSFADANTGLVVGYDTGLGVEYIGAIFRTTDGGQTWVLQPSPTTALPYDVDLINPDVATIVGDGGIILRTIDGGGR